MPQGDLNVANQSGAAFRADLNNQLLALGTMQSGAAEPAPTYAYMLWADTANGLLKQRNGSNNAWITVGTLDTANWGLLTTATAASTYLTQATAASTYLTQATAASTYAPLANPSFTGSVKLANGSVSVPSLSFTADTDTGFYRTGSGAVAIASDGIKGVEWPKVTQNEIDSVQIWPLRPLPAWTSGTYSGYWTYGTSLTPDNRQVFNIVSYSEKYTEVIANYGLVSGGNTYVDYLGIGDGSGAVGGPSSPHFIYGYTTRPDGLGYRGRFHLQQDGGWRTNYHDYGGLAATTNASTSIGTPMGPAFFCRAWVNFNGQGTVAIRSSGNVSSITDLGTGRYVVVFSSVMPDANYAAQFTASYPDSGSNNLSTCLTEGNTWNSAGFDIVAQQSGGGNYDPAFCCISIFR